MPIRPENAARYPADWKDISFRIRFSTDGAATDRVSLPPEEQRKLAAAYIASRARALDWSRDQHETTLLALFQPPRRENPE